MPVPQTLLSGRKRLTQLRWKALTVGTRRRLIRQRSSAADRRMPGHDYYNVYGEPVASSSRKHRPPAHNVYVQPPQHVMQGAAHWPAATLCRQRSLASVVAVLI